MSTGKNHQYSMVDLAKFLCALLIVSAHYVTENAGGRVHALIDYGVSLYVIVVPFFFACGGYFLFKKVFAAPDSGAKTIKSYLRRILVMYGLWSVIYATFQVLTWFRFGTSAGEVFRYVLTCVTYSTYRTIWFLPALCIGVVLTWVLYKKLGMRKMLIISGICYLIGALGVSYSFLLEKNDLLFKVLTGYNYIFESTRNGFFNGFPCVALGALIAHEETKGKKIGIVPNLIWTAVFGIGFVAEAFVLKLKFDAVNANTLLLLVPFTYVFLRLCLSIPLASGKTLVWMRKMSTTIFLCQRLFLSALPGLFPDSVFARLLSGNPYVGWGYVLAATLITAGVLQWLGKKNRLIGAMC